MIPVTPLTEIIPSHEGHQGPSCQEDPLQRHKLASHQVYHRIDSANRGNWRGGPKSPWVIEVSTSESQLCTQPLGFRVVNGRWGCSRSPPAGLYILISLIRD